MASGKRNGMLQMSVLLTLLCCTCQIISVKSHLGGNSRDNNGWRSGSSGSCRPVFVVKYPWIHSAGATPLSTAKSEEDCRDACVIDERCVSYQIETDPKYDLCWLQLNKENFVLENMYEPKTVTEFVLVSRCSVPDQSSTVKYDLCFPVFENKNPGWVSHTAVYAPDVKTEDECRATCVTIKACVSYQIDKKDGGSRCFVQYDDRKFTRDQLYQSVTITEYMLVDRCSRPKGLSPSCKPVFEVKYPWLHSIGAIPVSIVKNEDDCRNACVTDERCVSYQINTELTHNFCWLQLKKENFVLDNLMDLRTVTEYALVNRCSNQDPSSTVEHDLCFPIYEIKNPGWVSRMAVLAPTVRTEDECRVACDTIKACISYQIDGRLCFLQYDDRKFTRDQMFPSNTVKEYILVDRCPKLPEIVTTKSPEKCLPVFENKNPGWYSRQAISAPNEKTQDACSTACVANPACVSYQIEKKYGVMFCWLQHDEKRLIKDQLYKSETIEEYILIDRCHSSAVNAEKECFVTMKPSLFGQLSANATLNQSAKDERTCVAACIANSQCISVQFKVSDTQWQCYLQHNFHAFKPGNLMYHPNVTEYVITKRCEEVNACSRGFPLKRWGGPLFSFRVRRDLDKSFEAADEKRTTKESLRHESLQSEETTQSSGCHGIRNTEEMQREQPLLDRSLTA